jgi:Fe-Mn family superoxide dismutase
MTYKAENYDHLVGTAGFSDTILKNHFTLYQGYVTNTNKVVELLKALAADDKTTSPEYAELKRRFGWEFNGMRLHEHYFGNLTKEDSEFNADSEFGKKLVSEFGSFKAWESDFKGSGAMRGIGWVILVYDKQGDRLFNVWVNEHDLGHLAAAQPLLVMDVFEHAFMLDYGLNRADYIESFFKVVNWDEVAKRFDET